MREGIDLRRAGKDLEALRVFRQASALNPKSIRVHVQLATAHQALGQWLSAELHLKRALQEPEHSYVRRHREILERAYEVIGDHIGELEVQGGLPGATVALNGRSVGTLPMSAPVRVVVGTYQMEVSLAGHYTLRRPVGIESRRLIRESVEMLAVRPPVTDRNKVRARVGLDNSVAPAPNAGERPWAPDWVPWVAGGLSLAAGTTAIVAVMVRESHANAWNSDSCISTLQTRDALCGDELRDGKRAEDIAIISSAAAGALAIGALVTAAIHVKAETALGGAACGIGLLHATCSGSF